MKSDQVVNHVIEQLQEIQDGKLYLFYNSWGVNTLDKWNEAGAMNLQKKADTNWKRITN